MTETARLTLSRVRVHSFRGVGRAVKHIIRVVDSITGSGLDSLAGRGARRE